MKTKLELIMIVLQIELCWVFIKAWRKKVESNFEKGDCLIAEKSMCKNLQGCCDKMMLLSYRYKKLRSIGPCPMELDKRQVIAK